MSAALAANPGSTVAAIADAAGTGKPAARAALLEMEKAGTATRVKATRPNPDTWTLAGPAPDGSSLAADPEAGQADQPGDDPVGSPDPAAEAETVGGTGHDDPAEVGDTAAPAPEAEPEPDDAPAEADHEDAAPDERDTVGGTGHDDPAEAGDTAAPAPEAEPEPDDIPAEADHEDAVPDEPDAEAEPGSDPEGGDAPHDEDAPADAGDELDPALATDLIERLDQIRASADAAEMVLTASGDLKTVLAGLDEIAEQAAQARRALKAAIGGRKAPAVRPGGLRDKVLAHLVAHPDGEDWHGGSRRNKSPSVERGRVWPAI